MAGPYLCLVEWGHNSSSSKVVYHYNVSAGSPLLIDTST